MTGFEIAVIAGGVATMGVVAALAVANLKLAARVQKLTTECAAYAALEAKFAALCEKNQQDMLALGERVLAADKQVMHFRERLDAIETNRVSSQPQYGQLQNLLSQTGITDSEASAAEVALLSLLRRQQRG